jgi:hypothetical protein
MRKSEVHELMTRANACRMPRTAMHILRCLALACHYEDHFVVIGVRMIAEVSGTSRMTTKKWTRWLTEQGVLRRTGGEPIQSFRNESYCYEIRGSALWNKPLIPPPATNTIQRKIGGGGGANRG